MPTSNFHTQLLSSLATLRAGRLREAATDFFAALGYHSSRTLPLDSFARLREALDPRGLLTEESALISRWRSVHLLFQLSEAEIKAGTGGQLDLGMTAPWEAKDVRSYVFFALDLAPRADGSAPTRTELSQITRALNRLVPMPVLVLFRHGETVSLAIINRRKNMKDGTRDVLTRISLIRDIRCAEPHRAHLDLLRRFSLHSLREESGAIRTFADLDNAWQKLLSTQELKDSFYKALADWFRWAIAEIQLARLPDHTPDDASHRARATQEFTVRLICRLCYELPDGEAFTAIADRVVDALESVRVLDPACGSGAFPMGMLHRMVELLARVDPDNERWKQRLLDRLPAAMRADARKGIEGKSYNYLRKLGLIQKNLYGLDIQPLAALIAKLRFFLTLVIEQEVHAADPAHNYGLQALPNLETNLLCANSLADAGHDLLSGDVLRELREAREEYYQPQTSRERRDALALTIGQKLATLFPGFAQKTKGIVPTGATHLDRENMRRQQDAAWLAEWFKHATLAAPFFNVETFFPELVGEGATRHPAPFHIVIGNPPPTAAPKSPTR